MLLQSAKQPLDDIAFPILEFVEDSPRRCRESVPGAIAVAQLVYDRIAAGDWYPSRRANVKGKLCKERP